MAALATCCFGSERSNTVHRRRRHVYNVSNAAWDSALSSKMAYSKCWKIESYSSEKVSNIMASLPICLPSHGESGRYESRSRITSRPVIPFQSTSSDFRYLIQAGGSFLKL